MAAKWSSIAALLLVTAVLVGTCASGAHAQGDSGQVDFVNLCNYDSVVYFSNETTTFIIEAGKSLGIDLSDLESPIGPLYVVVEGQVYVLSVDALQQILGLTGVLVRIEIVCNGECGTGVITIRPFIQLFLLGKKIGSPTAAPYVCLDLVIP